LHISAKLQEGICKMSCWLTEEFDGGGKLINVVQFQGGNWSFVNFRGVIDEPCNFRGGNCLFTLNYKINKNKKETILTVFKLFNATLERLFISLICHLMQNPFNLKALSIMKFNICENNGGSKDQTVNH